MTMELRPTEQALVNTWTAETPMWKRRYTRRGVIFRITDGHCAYCGESIDLATFHVDHITPRSRGGDNSIGNLVPACESCNRLKADHLIGQFRVMLARKLRQIPKFSDEQVEYLRREYGIDDIDTAPYIRFWMETNILDIPLPRDGGGS